MKLNFSIGILFTALITVDVCDAASAAASRVLDEPAYSTGIFSADPKAFPRGAYEIYADIKSALTAKNAASISELRESLRTDLDKFTFFEELLEIANGILTHQANQLFDKNTDLELSNMETPHSKAHYEKWSKYLNETRKLIIKWTRKTNFLRTLLEGFLFTDAATTESTAASEASTAAVTLRDTAEATTIDTTDEGFIKSITSHMETREGMKDSSGKYALLNKKDGTTVGEVDTIIAHIQAKIMGYNMRSSSLAAQFPDMAIDTAAAGQLIETKAVHNACDTFRRNVATQLEHQFRGCNYISDAVEGMVRYGLPAGATKDEIRITLVVREKRQEYILGQFVERLQSVFRESPNVRKTIAPALDAFIEKDFGESIAKGSEEYNVHHIPLPVRVVNAKKTKWERRLTEAFRLRETLEAKAAV